VGEGEHWQKHQEGEEEGQHRVRFQVPTRCDGDWRGW
jgi:hypothetical protein